MDTTPFYPSRLQVIRLSHLLNTFVMQANRLCPLGKIRPRHSDRARAMVLGLFPKKESLFILALPNTGRAHFIQHIIVLFSMDSGLEAFSLYPTRGSIAAMTFRSTAPPGTRTNGSSRTKLDYCHDNSHI